MALVACSSATKLGAGVRSRLGRGWALALRGGQVGYNWSSIRTRERDFWGESGSVVREARVGESDGADVRNFLLQTS